MTRNLGMFAIAMPEDERTNLKTVTALARARKMSTGQFIAAAISEHYGDEIEVVLRQQAEIERNIELGNIDEPMLIPLTRGYATVIDIRDSDVTGVRWRAGGYDSWVYAVRNQKIDGVIQSISLHGLILERMIGRPIGAGEMVDHINGDTLNNRRSNLRLANHTTNQRNRRCQENSRSGVTGVRFNKGKWNAGITVHRRYIHLGRFADFDEAVAARHEAELRYFKEFSPLLSRQEPS